MNAIKTNPACKALYERLRANGKTGKQGLRGIPPSNHILSANLIAYSFAG
jgi:hypothetical protein